MHDYITLPFRKQPTSADKTDGFFSVLKRHYHHALTTRAYAKKPIHTLAKPLRPAVRPKFGRLAAIGYENPDAARLSQMLEFMSLGPLTSSFGIEELADLANSHEQLGYLFVNIDAFDDMEDAVSALIKFRGARPEVVVIIESGSLLVDDLGSERRSICEASLRAPVSFTRLKQGVRAAVDNKYEYFPAA